MDSLDLEEKIRLLRDPSVYGGEPVQVHQTHISVVFVAGDGAYKMKKPVDLGFVDYSTLARRRELCEAEVRLNSRLAPGIYRGVRSVVPVDDGLAYGDPDDHRAVDYAVEMERLDEDDNFLSHLHDDTLRAEWMVELGQKMAAFHDQCAQGEPGRHGCFDTVAKNARDNFEQSKNQVGFTVEPAVFERARAATEAALGQHREAISRRDSNLVTRDTHGDLRLEHVYRVDGELAVVDCIEFNDAFRFSDPVADIAFLVMDLRIRWGAELADAFVGAYFSARPGGEELLNFYVAYRSAVRAKVHGIAAAEPEVDDEGKERAFVKSRAHWLFTWGTLASPDEKPALVIVGGLPGTGKSTLGRLLAEHAGFVAIDSDHVRKELAGLDATASAQASVGSGIYTSNWTEKTYAECLRRATERLAAGERVVVSATFHAAARRDAFLERAHAMGVPGLFFECNLSKSVTLDRIAARFGDASDADDEIYRHVSEAWEDSSDFVAARTHRVETRTRELAVEQSLDILVGRGLARADRSPRAGAD